MLRPHKCALTGPIVCLATKMYKSNDVPSVPQGSVLRFASFTLDTARRCLYKDGSLVPLTARCVDLLVALASRSGTTVSKEELIQTAWGSAYGVSDGTLTQHVFLLRQALDERSKDHRFIVTIPRVGYRFVAAVICAQSNPISARVAEQYCRNAGQMLMKWSPSAIGAAIRLYQEALAADPECIDAYAGLATSHVIAADSAYATPRGAFLEAEAFARQAVTRDPNCVAARLALAKAAVALRLDVDEANRHVELALAANGASEAAIFLHAWHLLLLRRFDEAVEFGARACPPDRVSWYLRLVPAVVDLYRGEWTAAAIALQTAHEAFPAYWLGRLLLGQALFLVGQLEEACAHFRAICRSDFDPFLSGQVNVRTYALGYLAYAESMNGRTPDRSEGWRTLRARSCEGYVPPMCYVFARAGLGDLDGAWAALEQAWRERDPWFAQVFLNPFLAALREQHDFEKHVYDVCRE